MLLSWTPPPTLNLRVCEYAALDDALHNIEKKKKKMQVEVFLRFNILIIIFRRAYCNALWGNTYASNVNCLCRPIMQMKVVRLIEEILDFNLLATLLVYFILKLFLVFLCLKLCNNIARTLLV